MSNFLAVATVSASMRRMLQTIVGQDVNGATVTTVRPPGTSGALPTTGVNLYLYQVTPNANWRNNDLPTRRSDGSLLGLPEAAIDLHYLLSFHGDAAQLEPERLLGSVIRTLHARPILTRQTIEETLNDPTFGFLAGSDLAEQVDQIRFIPLGLNLDELAQLWNGVFNETEYHLSVAYRASVVLLTSEQEPPQPALPVKERRLLAVTFKQPVIDRVEDVAGFQAPVLVGSTIRVLGHRLRGRRTLVRLGGQEIEPDESDVTDSQIRFLLAAPFVAPNQLRAGVQAVQVVHPFLLGDPPEERGGAQSNAAPLMLRPQIERAVGRQIEDAGGGQVNAVIRLVLTPQVGASQRVDLLLNSTPGAAISQSYSFSALDRTSDLNVLEIPVRGVISGSYLVRLQVDGAESVLESDVDPGSPTFQQFIGPSAVLEVR